MKSKHIKSFVILFAAFSLPPVLYLIPGIGVLFFLPLLFWINIPALWLGLAKMVGEPQFGINEFGAWPQTPLAWILIFSFWALMALVLTVLSAIVERTLQRRHTEKNAPA